MGFFTERQRSPPCPTFTSRECLIKNRRESGKMKEARNSFVNALAQWKGPGNSLEDFDTGSVGVREKWEHHLLQELGWWDAEGGTGTGEPWCGGWAPCGRVTRPCRHWIAQDISSPAFRKGTLQSDPSAQSSQPSYFSFSSHVCCYLSEQHGGVTGT